MVDFNAKRNLGQVEFNYELYVGNTYLEFAEVLLDEATAGYAPAVGDILCYKTDDTNKHTKYDKSDAALVIMGIVDELKDDNTTPTPVTKISYAKNATVHYAALGYVGTLNAAEKLTLKEALRAKNINLAD